VRADDRELRIPCFALPHSAATDGLDAGLVPWRDETPDAVRGAIALVDVPLMRFPADFPVLLAGAVAGEADANWRRYDPGGTLAALNQVLPFSRHLMAVAPQNLIRGKFL